MTKEGWAFIFAAAVVVATGTLAAVVYAVARYVVWLNWRFNHNDREKLK